MILSKKNTNLLLLFLVVTVGLVRFVKAYFVWAPETPWPDVGTYMEIASNLQSPFQTGNREPLWIWYVWGFIRLFGANRFALAMIGGSAFVLSAFFYFKFLRELFSDFRVSLLALFIFVNNGLLLSTSLNATRDCLFLSGLMALTYFIFSKDKTERTRIVGLALSSLVVVGVRSTTLLPLFFILAFFTWQKKWKFYTPFFCVFLALLFNGPYYYLCYVQTGDPFYSSNIHAVWWRNFEFSTGESYGGKAVTWFHYIFAMHPFKEVLYWLWRGFLEIFFLPGALLRAMTGAVTPFLFAVYWLGLAKILLSKNRILFVVPLLTVNILLFTVHLNMDTRLFTPVVPFTTLAMAVGILTCMDYLFVLLKPKFLISRKVSYE